MLHRLKVLYRKLNNIHGVTMVELLVVVAIIGVALIPASTTLVTGLNNFTVESENMERVYEAQNALDHITDRVRFNTNGTIEFVENPINAGEVKALQITESGTTEIWTIYYDSTDRTLKEKLTDSVDSDVEDIKTILENVAGYSYDNIKLVGEGSEESLSRFDVAIVLEKREYGQETFMTTIYLRNN